MEKFAYKTWALMGLSLLSFHAGAAGLGKLSVLSALGEPLRAEIEIVSVQKSESSSLSAKLATAEAYRQINIDMSAVLLTLKFEVESRPNGQHVIKVTSPGAIADPFVDMLIELNWSSGRLVREYTFLLDPPGYQGAVARQPTAPAEAIAPAQEIIPPAETVRSPASEPLPAIPQQEQQPAEAQKAPETQEAAKEAPVEAAPAEPAVPAQQQPLAETPQAPAATESATVAAATAVKTTAVHEVKPGDTLGKIANQNRIEGVTFQQMLVALFRANEDAFIRENMNRVRAGKILSIPDRDTAASVSVEEARSIVIAQNTEFAEYQRRVGAAVAAAPARSTAAREASGRVGDASGEKTAQPAAPAKDQLKLSQAADTQRGGAAAAAALADDLAAKDKALKEANERVAILEKNVQEMQKLMELKATAAAQLQQQAQAAKSAPAQTQPAASAKAPQEEKAAPKGVEAAKIPEATKAPEGAASTTAAKAPDAAKAEAPKADASKAAQKVAAKAAPKAVQPAESSLLDDLLDNIAVLIGGAVAVLGLIGYAIYKWRKKKRDAQQVSSVMGSPSDTNSVLGSADGRNVDTGSSSLQGDFSQSSVGKSETEEIDPIAEADVYMAYGRDAQAEEILREALARDSSRQVIRLKLLEIYANRKDRGAFEALANELRDGTGGHGAEWEKAVSLGLSIDPENPLYGGTRSESAAQASTTQLISTPNFGDTVVTQAGAEHAAPMLDLDLGLGAETSPATAQPDISLDVPAPSDSGGISGGLDFDLGLGEDKPAEKSLTSTQIIGGDTVTEFIGSAPAPEVAASSLDAGLSIDFNLPDTVESSAAESPAMTQEVSAPPAAASDGIDFDLGMTMESAAPAEEPKAPDMNLSTISLDMGAPTDGNGSGEAHDARWQEVATKLDLAKAYEEMGDRDGARELLKEVVSEGDGAQQQRAQTMLQSLG